MLKRIESNSIADKKIIANEIFKSELVNDGGKHKVPCLKIEKTNAKTEWLYESDEIILFLKKIIAS